MAGGHPNKVKVGDVFGRLTVIGEGPWKYRASGYRERQSLCRCECGVEHVVSNNRLRMGTTRSCGCLATDTRTLPKGVAAENAVIRSLKYFAAARGCSWELTDDQVRELIYKPCRWCGRVGVNCCSTPAYNGECKYNGLDRINNEVRAYRLNNVWPCCGECNLMRGKKTPREFAELCALIVEHSAEQSLEPPADALRLTSDELDEPSRVFLAIGVARSRRRYRNLRIRTE